MPNRIYLDNAATSWPKPESVYVTVDRYQREVGAPAGRSPYTEALEVTRRVEAARAACARLLGIRRPAQLVFTANGTDALNLAIHGVLRPGNRVITSAAEHNSVLRPLAEWAGRGQIEVVSLPCDACGRLDPDDLRRELSAKPARLVALTHASNVTGAVQPIAELTAVAHQAGALILVDAAQTAGHLVCNLEQSEIDLWAASGHKGLVGPLGTGMLYLRPGLENEVLPSRHGGTGSRSHEDRQPATMPDRYESGNLNVPGILGLGAGVEYLLRQGMESVARRENALLARLLAGLAQIRGVRVYGPPGPENRVGVVSFSVEGYDPQEVATVLDATFRIQVRPGLHCAPHMHRALGTLDRGGTVRIGLGHFTTDDEINTTIAALTQLAPSA